MGAFLSLALEDAIEVATAVAQVGLVFVTLVLRQAFVIGRYAILLVAAGVIVRGAVAHIGALATGSGSSNKQYQQ